MNGRRVAGWLRPTAPRPAKDASQISLLPGDGITSVWPMKTSITTSTANARNGSKSVVRRFWLGALLALAGILHSGCAGLVLVGAGAAAGVGTYKYVNGELKATEQVTLDKAWSATQGAVKELEFVVISNQKDALTGKLVARTAADKKVQIALKKQGEQVTEIEIRVGTFGDEALSRIVHDKIKKRL